MQHKPCPPFPLAIDLGTGERGSLQGGRQMKAITKVMIALHSVTE